MDANGDAVDRMFALSLVTVVVDLLAIMHGPRLILGDTRLD